jgi:tRNA/rRNA methyltransferase
MTALRVVLVAPRNPLNIGAVARAMSNFGVFDLRLVNPYGVAYREAKSAVNASAILETAREFATVADAVADCALVVGTSSIGPRIPNHPVRRLELGGRLIARRLAREPVALLFGSEKFGLSNEDLSHCHWLLRIPTREEHGSMNLGQAVAVCLYEIMRRPEAAKAVREPKQEARGEDVERIYRLLAEILEHSGYIHDPASREMHLKLRRLVRRMHLTAQDANLWLGMLRKIQWKLLS